MSDFKLGFVLGFAVAANLTALVLFVAMRFVPAYVALSLAYRLWYWTRHHD